MIAPTKFLIIISSLFSNSQTDIYLSNKYTKCISYSDYQESILDSYKIGELITNENVIPFNLIEIINR